MINIHIAICQIQLPCRAMRFVLVQWRHSIRTSNISQTILMQEADESPKKNPMMRPDSLEYNQLKNGVNGEVLRIFNTFAREHSHYRIDNVAPAMYECFTQTRIFMQQVKYVRKAR